MKFWLPLCTYWTKQLVLPHPGIHHRITLHLGFTSLALAQCAEADGRGDRRERERLGQQPQHPTSTHPWYCPSRWQGGCKKMRCNDLCHCGGRWTSEEDWNWCLLRSVMGSSGKKDKKRKYFHYWEHGKQQAAHIAPVPSAVVLHPTAKSRTLPWD